MHSPSPKPQCTNSISDVRTIISRQNCHAQCGRFGDAGQASRRARTRHAYPNRNYSRRHLPDCQIGLVKEGPWACSYQKHWPGCGKSQEQVLTPRAAQLAQSGLVLRPQASPTRAASTQNTAQFPSCGAVLYVGAFQYDCWWSNSYVSSEPGCILWGHRDQNSNE